MGLGDTGSGRHAGYRSTVELVTDFGPGVGVASAGWGRGPYKGAMSVPGCWRAALLLSDLIGNFPLDAYRRGPLGIPVELPVPALLEQPAPPESRMDTVSAWILDLIWHGNAVGIIAARNRSGWPTAVTPVDVEQVAVRRVERRERDARAARLPVGTVVYEIDGELYLASDIVHMKGPHRPGALRGFGVLEAHLVGAVALAQELGAQAHGVATHGVPSVVIESLDPELDEPGAEQLKDKVMSSQRTRRPMVTNASTKLTPLAWDPTQTQLIEARKLSLLEQALIMGLDPSWLGAAQTSRVYSNIEQEATNLVRYSAGGHLGRLEGALSAAFPRGVWVEANLDAALRADTLTRYQAHSLAFGKWLTADEIRALERRAPLTKAQRTELAVAAHSALPPGAKGSDGGDGASSGDESGDDESERANPTGNAGELHHYWTISAEGLAKWATHPHPFSALLGHLKRYISPLSKAEATAAKWHHEVLGFWPGAHSGGKGEKRK